jgi:ribosome-associated protein
MEKSQKELVRLTVEGAEDKKAQDLVVLDLHEISSVTDFYVVASGTSDTQVRAIADGIRNKLAEKGIEPIGTEGYNGGTWVLLDYADMVVHVFHREKRLLYALEDLWSDAPRLRLSDLKKGTRKPRTQKHGETA